MEIFEQCIMNKVKHKEVAKQHRITVSRVGMLLGKIKRNPKLLLELHSKILDRTQQQVYVENVINNLNDQDYFIDSVDQVIKIIKDQTGADVKYRVVL